MQAYIIIIRWLIIICGLEIHIQIGQRSKCRKQKYQKKIGETMCVNLEQQRLPEKESKYVKLKIGKYQLLAGVFLLCSIVKYKLNTFNLDGNLADLIELIKTSGKWSHRECNVITGVTPSITFALFYWLEPVTGPAHLQGRGLDKGVDTTTSMQVLCCLRLL